MDEMISVGYEKENFERFESLGFWFGEEEKNIAAANIFGTLEKKTLYKSIQTLKSDINPMEESNFANPCDRYLQQVVICDIITPNEDFIPRFTLHTRHVTCDDSIIC